LYNYIKKKKLKIFNHYKKGRYQKDAPKALLTRLSEQMVLKAIEKDFITDYEGKLIFKKTKHLQ